MSAIIPRVSSLIHLPLHVLIRHWLSDSNTTDVICRFVAMERTSLSSNASPARGEGATVVLVAAVRQVPMERASLSSKHNSYRTFSISLVVGSICIYLDIVHQRWSPIVSSVFVTSAYSVNIIYSHRLEKFRNMTLCLENSLYRIRIPFIESRLVPCFPDKP